MKKLALLILLFCSPLYAVDYDYEQGGGDVNATTTTYSGQATTYCYEHASTAAPSNLTAGDAISTTYYYELSSTDTLSISEVAVSSPTDYYREEQSTATAVYHREETGTQPSFNADTLDSHDSDYFISASSVSENYALKDGAGVNTGTTYFWTAKQNLDGGIGVQGDLTHPDYVILPRSGYTFFGSNGPMFLSNTTDFASAGTGLEINGANVNIYPGAGGQFTSFGPLTCVGTATADYFTGDGSGLSNIPDKRENRLVLKLGSDDGTADIYADPADATEAFQDALDRFSQGTVSDGTLFLQSGEYVINGDLLLNRYDKERLFLRIEGEPGASIYSDLPNHYSIKMSTTAIPSLTHGIERLEIFDITFDNVGIDIEIPATGDIESNNIYIHDVFFKTEDTLYKIKNNVERSGRQGTDEIVLRDCLTYGTTFELESSNIGNIYVANMRDMIPSDTGFGAIKIGKCETLTLSNIFANSLSVVSTRYLRRANLSDITVFGSAGLSYDLSQHNGDVSVSNLLSPLLELKNIDPENLDRTIFVYDSLPQTLTVTENINLHLENSEWSTANFPVDSSNIKMWNCINGDPSKLATNMPMESASSITASHLAGNGSLITNLDPTAIDAGTLASSVICSSVAAGAVGVPQIGFTGTPSASTYARGDGSWASIPASNVINAPFTVAGGSSSTFSGVAGFSAGMQSNTISTLSGASLTLGGSTTDLRFNSSSNCTVQNAGSGELRLGCNGATTNVRVKFTEVEFAPNVRLDSKLVVGSSANNANGDLSVYSTASGRSAYGVLFSSSYTTSDTMHLGLNGGSLGDSKAKIYTGQARKIGIGTATSYDGTGYADSMTISSTTVTMVLPLTISSTTALGAQTATLNNAPVAGDPTHWFNVNIGTVTIAVPGWQVSP